MKVIKWPSGGPWAVAGLRRSPAEASATLGIPFGRSDDDLGPVLLGVLDDDRLGTVVFVWHEDAPERSLDVLVDAAIGRDEAVAALRRRFGLATMDFAWTTPFPTHPQAIAAAVAGSQGTRRMHRRTRLAPGRAEPGTSS